MSPQRPSTPGSTRDPARYRRGRGAAALALATALALGVGACSGASSSTASSSAADSSATQRQGAKALSQGGAAPVGPAATPTIASQQIVRRGESSLLVKDVPAAAAKVRALATAAGGVVLNESLSGTAGGTDPRGSMTIAVPADRFDDTMNQLAQVGDVVSRRTSADDVTATYVDTESRLATMRASVERVRTLMGQATKIEDIVALEAELSRRQADLESLEAQLRSLKDQVARSPITIELSTNRTDLAATGGGFMAGLAAGWRAFTASLVFLLTALGALLPFAVALAVVLLPLLWWLRRRRQVRGMPPRPAAVPPPASPSGPGPSGMPPAPAPLVAPASPPVTPAEREDAPPPGQG